MFSEYLKKCMKIVLKKIIIVTCIDRDKNIHELLYTIEENVPFKEQPKK